MSDIILKFILISMISTTKFMKIIKSILLSAFILFITQNIFTLVANLKSVKKPIRGGVVKPKKPQILKGLTLLMGEYTLLVYSPINPFILCSNVKNLFLLQTYRKPNKKETFMITNHFIIILYTYISYLLLIINIKNIYVHLLKDSGARNGVVKPNKPNFLHVYALLINNIENLFYTKRLKIKIICP